VTQRGDVVIARFPYVGGAGSKVRPAVVVQCDRLNAKIANTILVMVTGNLSLVGIEPTQFLIDPATSDGASSGLAHPSAVKCENLMTVDQKDIIKTLGALSPPLRQKLEECLKAALELS
jgi:mRNA-degrading endonuclease toxin of MazEF toxin-antitoxin module